MQPQRLFVLQTNVVNYPHVPHVYSLSVSKDPIKDEIWQKVSVLNRHSQFKGPQSLTMTTSY